jgi:hypothetical protein
MKEERYQEDITYNLDGRLEITVLNRKDLTYNQDRGQSKVLSRIE